MSLADQLTVGRALSVPFVVVLFVWDFPGHAYWASGLYALSMATDQVDGWLARRDGRSTPLGSLLDPVADKILVLSVLVVLVGEGMFRGWMVALIIVREFLISGLRLAALERGVVIEARDLSKLKTWVQAIACGIGGFGLAAEWGTTPAWWALLVALLLTWISAVDYARAAPALLRNTNTPV